MISVEKALKFVHSQKVKLKSGLSISTRNGLGYVLSGDLIAPISLPNFRQSSMDGYGLSDTKSLTYKVVGEIKAGDYYKKKLIREKQLEFLLVLMFLIQLNQL